MYFYDYHFVQTVYESNSDNFLLSKSLYAFKSPKTHLWYWAWVEEYQYEVYAIKFHLKNHKNSEKKYSLMTNLYEARPVINTCMRILLEIRNRVPMASFGFIGANSIGEDLTNTHRYRIYKRLIATYFGNEAYEHFMLVNKSAYILIPKIKIEADPHFPAMIDERFRELYPSLE